MHTIPQIRLLLAACIMRTLLWLSSTQSSYTPARRCACPSGTQESLLAQAACQSGGRLWTVSPTASACGRCGCMA